MKRVKYKISYFVLRNQEGVSFWKMESEIKFPRRVYSRINSPEGGITDVVLIGPSKTDTRNTGADIFKDS